MPLGQYCVDYLYLYTLTYLLENTHGKEQFQHLMENVSNPYIDEENQEDVNEFDAIYKHYTNPPEKHKEYSWGQENEKMTALYLFSLLKVGIDTKNDVIHDGFVAVLEKWLNDCKMQNMTENEYIDKCNLLRETRQDVDMFRRRFVGLRFKTGVWSEQYIDEDDISDTEDMDDDDYINGKLIGLVYSFRKTNGCTCHC